MKELKLALQQIRPSYFFYSILIICLSYILFETYFVFYAALASDEFVFARHIYEYTFNMPYRDFPPYKTILGYYLLSLPMFFSNAVLAPLFYIKQEIALINTSCILLASYWAMRFFDRKAILITLLAMVGNSMFLIYSTDLRVDMLTSWACLFSVFSVMGNRIRLGGFLASIAFLISQKAVWYFCAINGAMITCALTSSVSMYRLRSILIFNVATFIPILIYVAFWSLLAGLENVLTSVFYEAYIQAGINFFMDGYLACWRAMLTRGALVFLLCPMIFLSLFDKTKNEKENQQRLFIIVLAAIVLELFLNYKQPFPYNFVLIVPALFLLYNQFFTWLFQQKDQPHPSFIQLTSFSFIFIIFAYLYALSASIYLLMLPTINYLVIPLAVALLAYLFFFRGHRLIRQINLVIIITIFCLVGILYPLYRSIQTARILDGSYQRIMINVAASMLKENDDYVAGLPFLYRKDQPIEGMKNLIEPAAYFLNKPDEETKKLLLPSLYLIPSTQKKILSDFSKYPIKLILDNYRFSIIPESIKTYIINNYQQFYGSIYLYAPLIRAGNRAFDLKFSGKYRLQSHEPVSIDGKKTLPGKVINLAKGHHRSISTKAYRLTLVPETSARDLDLKYQSNMPNHMLKAIIS